MHEDNKYAVKTIEKNTTHYFTGFSIMLNLAFLSIAFFVYGKSVDLTIAFLAILALYDIASYLSFIPVIGWVCQGLIMYLWFTPFVENLTGLYNTWLLNLLFWVDMGVGVFISLLMAIVLFVALNS